MDVHTGSLALSALLSGVVSGVFAGIVLSVLPTLRALPPGDYVRLHAMLGRGFHPTMPLLVTVLLAAQIAVLCTDPGVPAALVVAGVAGVQVVSHFGNVPLNRIARTTQPDAIGPEWADPRPAWARWHYVRTALALACCATDLVLLL